MLGKPVVCYLRAGVARADARARSPSTSTSCRSSARRPETVEDVLTDLVEHPEKRAESRPSGAASSRSSGTPAEAGARRFDRVYSELLHA